MKRFLCHDRKRYFKILAILCLGIGLLTPGKILGQDSLDLSLNLYTEKNQFTLGEENDPVKLTMVFKNISNWPITTKLGFSEKPLQPFLLVTDPSKTKHREAGKIQPFEPPPGLFWNNKLTIQAETLERNWVRSVVIDDLRELFPVMKTLAGVYTIEAHVPVELFGWVIYDTRLGLLGVKDGESGWSGTIDSNKIQIEVVPADGAHLKVQVLDSRHSPPQPLSQVPVRVFKDDIPAENLAQAWDISDPVLVGTTKPEGWTSWSEGSSCQQKDTYTAIAYYQNRYQKASFEPDAGWQPGCIAALERQILFEAPPPSNTFSVLALNSLWVRAGAAILSGNVGTKYASSGLWLDSGVEVSIGINAKVGDIYGDSVKIFPYASAGDVYCNELENKGTIGNQISPLDLPVKTAPLPYLNVSPGDDAITVNPRKTLELLAGAYGDVEVKFRGTLRLTGGTEGQGPFVYHFKSLKLGWKSKLICDKRTEIRVDNLFSGGATAMLGPKAGVGLSAKDVLLYIAGINGGDGKLKSFPRAAVIGFNNKINANIYVPNGTLSIGTNCYLTGAFIAKDVIVGVASKVWLDSAF